HQPPREAPGSLGSTARSSSGAVVAGCPFLPTHRHPLCGKYRLHTLRYRSTQQSAPLVNSLPHLRDNTSEHLELLSVHSFMGEVLQYQSTNLVHLVVEGGEFVRADRERLLKDRQQPLLHLFPVLTRSSTAPCTPEPGVA